MTELYIAGRKADISDDRLIAMTYRSSDAAEPTATLSDYSKTISLMGTPNNNLIFGSTYKLDSSRSVYDARKRVDAVISIDGDAVDVGYIQLNKIVIGKDDKVQEYQCTFYGQLCDFFYSLMYDEKGAQRKLSDLYYRMADTDNIPLSKEEEDNYVWAYNRYFLLDAWRVLKEPNDNRKYYNLFAPVPTYSGYYDDFDSNKVLVYWDSLSDEAKAMFPTESGRPVVHDGGATYTDRKGWLLMETPRDLDEYEARDLRAVYQRPATPVRFILEAIADKYNNGGYTVRFDDDILNSPYYNNLWTVFKRIEFDEDNALEQRYAFSLSGCSFDYTDTYESAVSEVWVTDRSGNTSFDTTSLNRPKASISPILRYDIETPVSNLYTAYHSAMFGSIFMGGQVVRVHVYDGDTEVYTSKYNAYISVHGSLTDHEKGLLESQFLTQQHADTQFNYLSFSSLNARDADTSFYAKPQPAISVPIPKSENVRIKIEYRDMKAWISFGTDNPETWGPASFPDKYNFPVQHQWTATTTFDSEVISGIYDDVSSDVQLSMVNKAMCMNTDATPFDYLIGFAKMLGLRFIANYQSKRIDIVPRYKYYRDKVHDITEYVDLDGGIDIYPTTQNRKWQQYGLSVGDTYAARLYKGKYGSEYGRLSVDTGYMFNSDTRDNYESVKLRNCIPYQLHSIYFTDTDNIISPLYSPAFGLTLWDSGQTENTSTRHGKEPWATSMDIFDPLPKMCLFEGADYEPSDICDTLVFFNGFTEEMQPFVISDNIRAMQELNGNPCYLAVSGLQTTYESISSTAETLNHYTGNTMPVFSNLFYSGNVLTDTMDFGAPKSMFIKDTMGYTQGHTIYDKWWKGYVEDILDEDSKAIEVRMFVKVNPHELMRDFVYFQDALWTVESITDYTYDKYGLCRVRLGKVKAMANYISNQR